MDKDRRDEVAGLLGAARIASVSVPELPDELAPANEAEGYAVQAALADWFTARGLGEAIGYKVGATTAGMQEYLGVKGPAFGRIMAANLHQSPARLHRDRFLNPGLECEIAVRMGADAPASDAPWTWPDMVARIDSVMPAIEIVENRYDDFLKRGIGTLVADDFFHTACVLGAPASGWRDLDLASVAGRMIVGGEAAGTGTGADVMGHPLEVVAWLANTLAGQGLMLKSGDIVLTGSMTPVHWIENLPCAASVDIAGLGSCAVELT